MKTQLDIFPSLLVTALLIASPLALSDSIKEKDQHKKQRIAQAQSAAPVSVSGQATIMDGDQLLVKGSNGWTCMPDTFPGDNAPICVDQTWQDLMKALGSQQDFKPQAIGISYMLQGDKGAGVSNSDPFHADHKAAHDYVETGPHLMIVVPKELLKGITDDPNKGGPYVMWGDTPYAHIMIPVEDLKQ